MMNQTGPHKFYEFFSGGGMARIGLGPRWNCVFANDFDPLKAKTYKANFDDGHFRADDVWALDTSDLPGHADLAWASSPCQDFSLAGGRAGLAGDGSSAFYGFWQLIEDLRDEGRAPKILVVENVVGLLTSHEGADFRELCALLAESGYNFGAVEIDAARFVPHSRPRVFVVAFLGEPPEQLTRIEPLLPHHSARIVSAYEGLTTEQKKQWRWWALDFPPAGSQTLQDILETDEHIEWFDEGRVKQFMLLMNSRHRNKLEEALHRGDRTVGTLFRRMRIENGEKVQRAELNFSGVAGCLRTPRGGSSQQFLVVVENARVRVRHLTVSEVSRLMGLPKTYRMPGKRTAALTVAGDGVVVPVVEFLSNTLLIPLIESLQRDHQDGQEQGRPMADAG